jgi:hypothetical protein
VLLTRSPLESPRKGLSVRLACVKHAASVRPEPGSNSPNKIQRNLTNHPNDDTKTTTPSTRGRQRCGKKTNNKQKPPNTLLSSQTTHPLRPPDRLAALGRGVVVGRRGSHRSGLPLGCHRARRTGRVATASQSYVRDRSESNNLLRRRFQPGGSTERVLQLSRCLRYSACPGAAPAIVRGGSHQAPGSTPRSRSCCYSPIPRPRQ